MRAVWSGEIKDLSEIRTASRVTERFSLGESISPCSTPPTTFFVLLGYPEPPISGGFGALQTIISDQYSGEYEVCDSDDG